MLHRWGFPLCISVTSPSPQISKSPIHSSRGQLVIFKSASIQRSNWFGCQLSISGKRAHPGTGPDISNCCKPSSLLKPDGNARRLQADDRRSSAKSCRKGNQSNTSSQLPREAPTSMPRPIRLEPSIRSQQGASDVLYRGIAHSENTSVAVLASLRVQESKVPSSSSWFS